VGLRFDGTMRGNLAVHNAFRFSALTLSPFGFSQFRAMPAFLSRPVLSSAPMLELHGKYPISVSDPRSGFPAADYSPVKTGGTGDAPVSSFVFFARSVTAADGPSPASNLGSCAIQTDRTPARISEAWFCSQS
jgi:hypothetical protein